MEEPDIKPTAEKKKEVEKEPTTAAPEPEKGGGGGGGGWGGWGFSPLSYLADIQKAAAVAAEEISRNAAAVAQTAAKSISDVQNVAEDTESTEGKDDTEDSATEGQDGDEQEMLRKVALDKLEKAGGDTFFGQGLKVIDDSVENLASGAWKALGTAWKGGSEFIQKLEHSVAESIQQGGTPGSGAPSLLEAGKAITFKGIQVLENVGKETMDLLISETGFDVGKKSDGADHQVDEEVSFDRCFYIYGGPEQLEELEALSSHYTLLFNRRKAKLLPEQKSFYEGKVKQVQQILDLSAETEDTAAEPDKGKKIETLADGSDEEMKNLCDSTVSKAADMAAGYCLRVLDVLGISAESRFTNALAALAANDIVQRTTGRLESIHSEGVHRLSEMCCFAASQLLMLAKSVIASANKSQEENAEEEIMKIKWPEDSLEKARIIRSKAQLMTESLDAVSNSFITGISDVAGAYLAAMKATASAEAPPEKSIQDKASTLSENLRADWVTAVSKIQDGLQNLCFVVVSSSMASA
ncbi:hypothetical protein Cgig2_032455 [Carnegiea gigantea]|uniref:DUF7798 domain-containing protein n=1 Tax=Carnegiea gigantea TaxID=171969 RepID=A0A9Q1KVU3_9CARY|nr:hypothetical protein Cgig2_032455 [Carnegiea gigantea]